ncbi:hypothetical protein [Saccharopolyspora sp. NPDC049357]|uniref:hypothetical protein n=1 Tax=Saccharopolyspora sp. NPDC049357 TaxID=3154507 RepID=UPI003442F568
MNERSRTSATAAASESIALWITRLADTRCGRLRVFRARVPEGTPVIVSGQYNEAPAEGGRSTTGSRWCCGLAPLAGITDPHIVFHVQGREWHAACGALSVGVWRR